MKKIVVTRITVLLLMLFLSVTVLSPTVFATSQADLVSVTPVQQAKSNWCWAACAEMLGKTMYPSTTRTQWNVVRYVKGSCSNPYPDVGGSRPDTAAGAAYVTYNNVSFSYVYYAWTFHELLQSIVAKKPVIASSGQYVNGERISGHATLIYGCQFVDNGYESNYYIDYIDPATKEREHCRYVEFCNGVYNKKMYDATIDVK